MDAVTSREVYAAAVASAREFVTKQASPEQYELPYQIAKNIKEQCRVRFNAVGQELADMMSKIIDENAGSLNG